MTIYRSATAHGAAVLPASGVFRILHVCIANQCRSPLAELLTNHELGMAPTVDLYGWEIDSAGVNGVDGQPMHPLADHALSALGVDSGGFRSRRLTRQLAAAADLILTATAAERDHVIASRPSVLPVTFTLLEFARLLSAVPGDARIAAPSPAVRARTVVGMARAARGRVPYVEPEADDVPDPDRTVPAFTACAAEIHRAVRTVVAALTEPAPRMASGRA